MANAWYPSGKLGVCGGGSINMDWDDTSGGKLLKVMLLTTGLANNGYVSSNTTVSQVSANEVSGTGYTGGFAGSGRKSLITPNVPTVSLSGTTVIFDASDAQWVSANGFTPGSAQVFRQLSTDTTDATLALIMHFDTGTGSDVFNVATNGSNLDLIWSASGLANIA